MSRMLTQQNCQVPDTVDRIFKKMRFNLNIDEKYLNICSKLAMILNYLNLLENHVISR